MSEVRLPEIIAEPLSEGDPDVRLSDIIAEPLGGGSPNARLAEIILEPLADAYSSVRLSLIILESLHPVGPEEFMSTTPFPGFGNSIANPAVPAGADPFNTALPGLTFSVHKKPMFRTRISEAASGNEVRNALMQYPIWDFELTYDYLEDRTGADSSLKTIMGFFLSRQGSYDSWLFKDPDDYLCDNHYCGDADAVTTEFPLSRVMGEFRERVGQADTANTISVFLTVEESTTIPGVGPYTVTVTEAASFIEDGGVVKGGIPMTAVAGAPAAGEYSVAAGVYTFNAADATDAIDITYRYTVDPADYTITLPNRLIFDVAPASGIVTWSGQFYFVCRFTEDQQDYEKFMDKLWNLQECIFRSIIQ